MAIACCVFTAVYLALSSGQSLISDSVSWGFLPTPMLLQAPEAPEQRRKKNKTGGVEGGKCGHTQTGSGCNFLRKLSEPFLVQFYR